MTRKILILWAIIFVVTLFGILVCLRPLSEFMLINSPHNYAPYAREYLSNGEPQKAVDYLLAVIRFLGSENRTEAYELIAQAYTDLGDEARQELWRSRAEFEATWLGATPQTVPALADRWDRVSALAVSAAKRLGADTESLPVEWLQRMTEKTFYAKAKEDAPIEEWVAVRTAQQNLGLLLASGAQLVIGGAGIAIPGTVLLQSAGFEQGKGGLAVHENVALIDAKLPGYHVVALNPSTGEHSPPKNFNTYADRAASQRMFEHVESIPEGWMVFLVTSDEAAKMADSLVVENTFALVGIELPRFRLKKRAPGYRESFVGLGFKSGKGTCLLGDRYGRPATLIALPRNSGI